MSLDTLNGKVNLTVKPRTQNGARLRLKGKGLPTKSGTGDLYVDIEVRVPENPSEKEMDLLRELAESSTFNPRPGGNRAQKTSGSG